MKHEAFLTSKMIITMKIITLRYYHPRNNNITTPSRCIVNIYFYSVSFAHVPKARYSETYVLLYCRSTTLRVPLPRDGRRERRPAPAAGLSLRDRLAPGPGQRRCARPGQSGTPASGHAHVAALEPAQSLPPACRARARALEGRRRFQFTNVLYVPAVLHAV